MHSQLTKSVRTTANTATAHLAAAKKTRLMDRPPPQLLPASSPKTQLQLPHSSRPARVSAKDSSKHTLALIRMPAQVCSLL